MGSYSPLLILVILCDGIKSAEDWQRNWTGNNGGSLHGDL